MKICKAEPKRQVVKELDKDHIFYNGRQYVSLRHFLEIKVKAPKVGKWEKYSMPRCGEQHFICTNCGKYVAYLEHHIKDLKYCPNCGAKMESEEKG
jgi:predicted RNA-binding Zn-ribbon protein involved in translation (DUF1610 family)